MVYSPRGPSASWTEPALIHAHLPLGLACAPGCTRARVSRAQAQVDGHDAPHPSQFSPPYISPPSPSPPFPFRSSPTMPTTSSARPSRPSVYQHLESVFMSVSTGVSASSTWCPTVLRAHPRPMPGRARRRPKPDKRGQGGG